jgi:hypothetical protein
MAEKILIPTDRITQHDAAAVLWVLRHDGGVNPGGFKEKLLEAAIVADTHNMARLSLGFEGLMAALMVYKKLPTGVQILQHIASGRIYLPVEDFVPVPNG